MKQFSISTYIDIELDIENGLNQILILILRLISISIYIDIDIEPQNPILPNSDAKGFYGASSVKLECYGSSFIDV